MGTQKLTHTFQYTRTVFRLRKYATVHFTKEINRGKTQSCFFLFFLFGFFHSFAPRVLVWDAIFLFTIKYVGCNELEQTCMYECVYVMCWKCTWKPRETEQFNRSALFTLLRPTKCDAYMQCARVCVCVCVGKINEGATNDNNNMVAMAVTMMVAVAATAAMLQFRQMHPHFNGKM